MALRRNNTEQGNMYDFVTLMYSPVRGRCSHDCEYCYMKRFPLGEMKLDEKDLKVDLGRGETVFVGYTIDLFASDVPAEWITRVLAHLREYPSNRYLLQTKNPQRLTEFIDEWPSDVILATTIETNRAGYYESKAPDYSNRAGCIGVLSEKGYETMVTIEPIFDFDLEPMIDLIVTANPVWVNIGADSKGHNLPEPPAEKVKALVAALQEKMKVKLKRNITRICEDLKER